MANAIVHYIKHWDNDTKGSITVTDVRTLSEEIRRVEEELLAEAHEDGASKNAYPWELFTITKAELVDNVQSYAGYRSSI